MEKRRLFKTLLGLALAVSLSQSLQAASAGVPAGLPGAAAALVPAAVEPVPVPGYIRLMGRAALSYATNAGYFIGRMNLAAASYAANAGYAAAGLVGRYCQTRVSASLPTSVVDVVATGARAARAASSLPEAASSIAASVAQTASASVPASLPTFREIAGVYYLSRAAQAGLTRASDSSLAGRVPGASSFLGFTSYIPTALKWYTIYDYMKTANATTPNHGVIVKERDRNGRIVEGGNIQLSTSNMLTTARIAAIGAAASIAPAVALNMLPKAGAFAFGTHASNFIKPFATLALLYTAHKAYQEFSGSTTTVTAPAAPSAPAAVPLVDMNGAKSVTVTRVPGALQQGSALVDVTVRR